MQGKIRLPNDLFEFDDELRDKFVEHHSYSNRSNFYLTKSDFYPPSDDRMWESNLEDIRDGDNFIDYCQYIFGVLKEEGYYD